MEHRIIFVTLVLLVLLAFGLYIWQRSLVPRWEIVIQDKYTGRTRILEPNPKWFGNECVEANDKLTCTYTFNDAIFEAGDTLSIRIIYNE